MVPIIFWTLRVKHFLRIIFRTQNCILLRIPRRMNTFLVLEDNSWKTFHPKKWKGLCRKYEKGYRLKSTHFRSWSGPIRVLSDVLVSRNWNKTNIFCIKLVGLNRWYSANTFPIWELWYTRGAWQLRFAPIVI